MAIQALVKYPLFINGDWVEPAAGAYFDVLNPATEEAMGAAPDGSVEDVNRAIAAARRAFDEGPWPRMAPKERARILRQIGDNLQKRVGEIRTLLTAESGVTQALAHSIQGDDSIRFYNYYADAVEKFDFAEPMPVQHGPDMMMAMGFVSNGMTLYEPVGVCTLITPFNFPFYVNNMKIGPALAAGNTVVLKPSPLTPLIALLEAQAIAESDLPKGVFNVVTTNTLDASRALVTDTRIDKVSFTGSVATAKAIIADSASSIKRLTMELGGKSAFIIRADADIDRAAQTAMMPCVMHCGQGCAMTTRVLVHRSLHDGLLERMVAGLKMVKIGDPSDPEVMMGPVISAQQRERIEGYIASGKQEAKLIYGGGRPSHLSRGYYIEPTVFDAPNNAIRITQEEIFGPVQTVLTYDTDEEAIAIANDSPYGLSGAISTRDVGAGIEMAKRIRTGTIRVNNGSMSFDVPFGGFKQSGYGREYGVWAMRDFLETKGITWSN